MSDVWYLSQGDTGPVLTGTLEYEVSPGVWAAQNLTGATAVTLTLYRSSGTVYKADAPLTVLSATEGRVKYPWVAADSQQGMLTGKARVTFADATVQSFPNTGHFQIRVSR